MINEPDLTRLQSYQDAAALVNTSVTPASQPFGGVFVANPDTDAVNGNSTTTTSSATPTMRDFRRLDVRLCWGCVTLFVVLILVC